MSGGFEHTEVEGGVHLTNDTCTENVEVVIDTLGTRRLAVDASFTSTPTPGASPTAFTKDYRMRLVENVNLTNNQWVEVYRRGDINEIIEPHATGRVDSLHLLCNTKPYDVRVLIDGYNVTQDISTDALDALGLAANGNFAGTVRMYIHSNQAAAFGITLDWAPGGILYIQEFVIEIQARANGKKLSELLIHQNENP